MSLALDAELHWLQEPQHQGTQRKHRVGWCKAERPGGGLSIFQKRHITENVKGGRYAKRTEAGKTN